MVGDQCIRVETGIPPGELAREVGDHLVGGLRLVEVFGDDLPAGLREGFDALRKSGPFEPFLLGDPVGECSGLHLADRGLEHGIREEKRPARDPDKLSGGPGDRAAGSSQLVPLVEFQRCAKHGMFEEILFCGPCAGGHCEAFGQSRNESLGKELEFPEAGGLAVPEDQVDHGLGATLHGEVEGCHAQVAGDVGHVGLWPGEDVHDPPFVEHVGNAGLPAGGLDRPGKAHDVRGVLDIEFRLPDLLHVGEPGQPLDPPLECGLGLGVGNLSTEKPLAPGFDDLLVNAGFELREVLGAHPIEECLADSLDIRLFQAGLCGDLVGGAGTLAHESEGFLLLSSEGIFKLPDDLLFFEPDKNPVFKDVIRADPGGFQLGEECFCLGIDQVRLFLGVGRVVDLLLCRLAGFEHEFQKEFPVTLCRGLERVPAGGHRAACGCSAAAVGIPEDIERGPVGGVTCAGHPCP